MSIGQPYVPSESDERDEEKEAMLWIKDQGLTMVEYIDSHLKGREASIAKTKIEEAVMWSLKGLTG